jgi:hypothetical protein
MSYQDELHYTTDKRCGFERLRVDVAQTGFFEGREFRTFKELNIAPGATYVIKGVVPINIILMALAVNIDSGWLRVGSYAGGTEGGSFSETLPVIPANSMDLGVNRRQSQGHQAYVPQVIVTAGGTHTGGTEIDVLRIKVNSVSAQAATVGQDADSVRGVAPTTYYLRLLNLSGTDAVTGVMTSRWEERQVGFFQT